MYGKAIAEINTVENGRNRDRIEEWLSNDMLTNFSSEVVWLRPAGAEGV